MFVFIYLYLLGGGFQHVMCSILQIPVQIPSDTEPTTIYATIGTVVGSVRLWN